MIGTAQKTVFHGCAEHELRGLSAWSTELRRTVRADASPFNERTIWLAESLASTEGEASLEKRVAAATAHLFECMPLRIRHGERLVGWHPNSHLDARAQQEVGAANARIGAVWRGVCSEGHLAPDYPTLVQVGLDGIRADIADGRARLSEDEPDSAPSRTFYAAAETALVGLQSLIRRYAALARETSAEAQDAAWGAELAEIALVCEWIAGNAPRSFREAIQLSWFMFLSIAIEAGPHHHCYGPGRLDQYLYPFYERERSAGTLNEALADDLLAQLFIKCNEFETQGMSAVILVVGGRRADGSDATNALSYRLLDISDRVRMYFPGVDVSWHEDMDPNFMRAAVKLLRNENGQPAFFNSDVIVRGLLDKGVPYAHAVDHLPSTCTETSVMGRSNPHVAWPYINLPMGLLYALFGGRHPITGDTGRFAEDMGYRHGCSDMGVPQDPGAVVPGVPRTYEELRKAYDAVIQLAAAGTIDVCNRSLHMESVHRPFPLLSCLVEGCIRRGRNISDGSALYNFIQPEAVGASNVVDSLAAVRTLTQEQDRYTLNDFRSAIRADFEGYGELLRASRSDCPKHGNDVAWVNDLFAEVTGAWCGCFDQQRNFFGGPFLPGFLGWTVWIAYGEATPATPDGRRSGAPLANSLANCTGVQVKGFPSVMLSAGGFDQSRGLGGIVFNVRFGSRQLASEKGAEALAGLIEGAFDTGCYQLQVNVVSTAALRTAQERPDEHADLFVRIGGYLVPFVKLPKAAQEDVIARVELDL